jgi:kindlin 2
LSSELIGKSTENLQEEIDDDDDVDAALNRLEMTLELNDMTPATKFEPEQTDISGQFELKDYLKIVKKPKSTFKRIKTYFVSLKEQNLYCFKTADQESTPIVTYDLRNSEIQPDLDVQSGKFSIYLKMTDSNIDISMRCASLDSYAKWLAALKILSKTKTVDENLYKYEIETIIALADLQQQEKKHYKSMSNVFFEPDNYVPLRLFKKFKAKEVKLIQPFWLKYLISNFVFEKLIKRIMESHSNFSNLDLVDTKLRYIKLWQEVADFGVSYFVVKFKSLKAREVCYFSPISLHAHRNQLLYQRKFSV